MCTQKMRTLSYIEAEKITFPPKPDRQTYRQTDRQTDIQIYRHTDIHTYKHTDIRTDISVYRVALLLKTNLVRQHQSLSEIKYKLKYI